MRAISLWQPWATAIAVGAKRVETRHWYTKYRGPLAIHAAKRCNVSEMIYYASLPNWCGALRPLGLVMGSTRRLEDQLPFGAIVATCVLADCRLTDSFSVAEVHTPRRPAAEKSAAYDWTEAQMGNFDLGRFGWVLEQVRALPTPIPFKGAQGFFEVPDGALQ